MPKLPAGFSSRSAAFPVRAALVSLALSIIACNSEAPESAQRDAVQPASENAAAPETEIVSAGASSRCLPQRGGPPSIFGELTGYSLDLMQRRRSNEMSEEDFDAAMQDLQAANAAMAQQEFERACGLADTLKAKYRLGS